MEKNEIVISLYPQIMKNIRSGIKNFEFRPFEKSSESGKLTFWIYETAPISRLTSKMIVKNPVKELPKGKAYGLGNASFYKNINEGRCAYEIVELIELDNQIDLTELRKINFFPPQNFVYLSNFPILSELIKQQKKLSHFIGLEDKMWYTTKSNI